MNFLRNKWVWITIVCWALTPYMFHLGYLERGYRAIGGEALFLLLPFVLWAICKTLKDTITDIKKELKSND